MSRQGGRKPGRGAGKKAPQRPSGSAETRRLGLLVFGAVFLVLFVAIAIAEGLGDPSIPSGDIAVIEDAPGDRGKISKADFDHALEIVLAEGQGKAPKPGSAEYEAAEAKAVDTLLQSVWLEGQAEEMGIEVTDQDIAKKLNEVKAENFPKEAEFQQFAKERKFTPEDINERVKLELVTEEIQKQLGENPPAPSPREIENYYEAAKATQFTKPPSRDVRLILNKEEEKAEKALAALEAGNSTAKTWSRVAKEFSEDPATKENGGLQKGVAEGALEEPVGGEVFDALEGQLVGPVKGPRGFYVFEVQSSEEETVQSLDEVEDQIGSQLAQQLAQEELATFGASFGSRWSSRTFCDEEYLSERCGNFEGDGRPAGAPPACYEEDPEGGRPEACPAPVFQAVPALPGSVTPLAPQGNPLAQRPVPAGEPKPAGEEGATGLPPGSIPPPTE